MTRGSTATGPGLSCLQPQLVPGVSKQERQVHRRVWSSTCRRALLHRLGDTEGRRRPGGRRHWAIWHRSRTQAAGTEAVGRRVLRASPRRGKGTARVTPSRVLLTREFPHAGWRQVINTCSPTAPLTRFLVGTAGPSPLAPSPLLPWLPKLLPDKLL